MIPYLEHITTFQRLIINALCFISHSVIYPICFILNQFRFFLKYFVFGLPHPIKKVEVQDESDDSKNKEEDQDLPFNLARRREQLITELISTEKEYEDTLEKDYDYYQPTFSPLVDQETMTLFFGKDFNVLIETSVRVFITAREDSKFGPKDTIIGKTFIDAYDTIMQIKEYITKYQKALLKFNDIYYSDKNFKKKVKSLERRTKTTFSDFLKMPLERIIKYQTILDDLLKNTPEWHEDFSYLNEITSRFRPTTELAQTELSEGQRIIDLFKLERKIRSCPPLREIKRSFVGTWQLTSENMFIHVLSDRLLIVQQKIELLSRKKYFAMKKDINLAKVKEVVKVDNGIKLSIVDEGDIVISIKLQADELFDAIKMNSMISRHSE